MRNPLEQVERLLVGVRFHDADTETLLGSHSLCFRHQRCVPGTDEDAD